MMTVYSVLIYEYIQTFSVGNADVPWSTTNTLTLTPTTIARLVPGENCCDDCSVWGSDARVYYWPTPAPSPPVSELVNSVGYTFRSPSIYLTIGGLIANNSCGYMHLNAGAETLAFDPQELSTAPAYTWDTTYNTGTDPYWGMSTREWLSWVLAGDSFTQATWHDQSCGGSKESFWGFPGWPDTFTQQSVCWATISSILVNPPTSTDCVQFTVTQEPCFPSLAVPDRITDLFSGMSAPAGCYPGQLGYWDPPSALSPGNGFRTVDPLGSNPSQPSSGAVPGATPYTVTAPTTQDPNKPQQPTPGSGFSNPVGPAATNDPSPNGKPNPQNDPPGKPPNQGQSPPSGSSDSDPHLANDPPQNDPRPGDSPPQNNPSPTFQSPPPPTAAPKYIIGSSTLTPGGLITMSGTAISLQADGSTVVVGGKTEVISDFLASVNGASLVIGGQTVALTPVGSVVIAGTTMPLSSMLAGNAYIVAEGTAVPLSAILAGNGYVVVGGKDVPVSALLAGNGYAVIGGKTIAASALLGYASVVAGGKTTPLSAFLTDSPKSLPSDASVVIGGQTMALSSVIAGIQMTGTGGGVSGTGTQVGLGSVIASVGGLDPALSSAAVTTNTRGNNSLDGGIFRSAGSRLRNFSIMGIIAFGGLIVTFML